MLGGSDALRCYEEKICLCKCEIRNINPREFILIEIIQHQTADFNRREVDIELADIPETSASWTISVFSQDLQIYEKTIEIKRLRSDGIINFLRKFHKKFLSRILFQFGLIQNIRRSDSRNRQGRVESIELLRCQYGKWQISDSLVVTEQ